MGKKQFDKNIKDKLEELHIDYDAASWDSFEEKLDEAMTEQEIDDLDFDQQIRENLQGNLGFDFKEEHWQELSTRIDYDNELANRIYLFKIIELVILVLLAYSFFQIEPIKHPTKSLPLYAHSEIFKSIDEEKILEQTISSNVVAQDNFINIIPLSPVIIERSEEEVFSSINNKFAALQSNKHESLTIASVPTIDLRESNKLLSKYSGELLEDAIINITKSLDERESIAINRLDYEYEETITTPARAKRGSEKWLSISTSADINLVNTPTNFLINGRDKLLGAAGVSGAITYSVKSGKNELEAGLGYSYKNYDPDLREVFNIGSDGTRGNSLYRTSLNRIAFHIAQVPINYRRYVVDNHKWAVFTTLGVTHNFILYSDYNLTDELLSGIWSPWTYRKANSDLLKRTFYTGLLQNIETVTQVKKRSSSPSDREFRTEGNIFDNAFITSYTGLGVQRYFGTGRSVFIEAGYHHQFFGDKLGPNNDQINTFSFKLGGKFRI